MKTKHMDEPNEKSDTSAHIRSRAKILAVGGGKGGVGKTVLSASLGAGLAMLNHRVIIADSDLGGSDLHAVMGIHKPEKTFYDFYNHDVENLEDALTDYLPVDGLKIICGAVGTYGIANLAHNQKKRFIRHLRSLDADYIILDLGAGSSYHVLDFFLAADLGIIVVNPDPLSILEAYNFIKQTLFRRFAQMIRRHEGALEIVKRIASQEIHKESATVEDLIKGVKKKDSAIGEQMEKFLASYHPSILINFFQKQEDHDQVMAIKTASLDLLSVETDYLGAVHADDHVRAALHEGKPFIVLDPKAQSSRDVAEIILRIRNSRRLQALRDKMTLRKKGKTLHNLKKFDTAVICSIRCQYWEECGFKEGGLPCSLRHLRGIQGMHRE